ncbi:hypothetical protein [Tropicibacter naphthalenivorans]|uniref:hypothetical protein n=1 Tax=Tropicibacter naphthalenivorans TaxID=441103 RepID=UPI00117D3506|nr:hypothetical protein [Tropicibacter naphthalenivorans]
MRLGFTISAALALSACMQAGTVQEPRNTGRGIAAKLHTGVTKAEADVALGFDAGYERNPNDFDEACASYAYDVGDKTEYVHAVFRQGQLTRATDGHLTLCTYAAPAE